MDTTIGIENKFLKFKNENLEKDEQFLRNLSKFLKKEMIPKFLVDVAKDEESAPNDSFSLTEYLHKYGIAVRYYGEIIKLIDTDAKFKRTNTWVKILAIRDIIRRSAKHVFNSIIKDVPDYLMKDFCAYFLNILLAPASSIKNLEAFEVCYVNGTIVNVKHSDKDSNVVLNSNVNTNNVNSTSVVDNSKKKKKGKGKKKKAKDGKSEEDEQIKFLITDTLSSTNKYMNTLIELKDDSIKKFFIKPSELWRRIKEIATKRYGFTFADKTSYEYVEPLMNKFG